MSRFRHRTAAAVAAAVMAALAAACSSSGGGTGDEPQRTNVVTATDAEGPGADIPRTRPSVPAPSSTAPTPSSVAPVGGAALPALSLLLDAAEPLRRHTLGPDTFEVWICRVALDIEDATYNSAPLRLPLEAVTVASQLDRYVGAYFREISHNQYQPRFVEGGAVTIAGRQTNRDCVDQALEGSSDRADGVVVVADAEHAANQPGGWGRPGRICVSEDACTARDTGRATYIGASDFHPDWGEIPAVDLQEHEIGHSLGLPHSGDNGRHTSALDLMSNSAAPRDVDPARRHGPDTVGINRLAMGWLPLDDVAVVSQGERQRLLLAPSGDPSGQRLAVLELDDERFLTVEVLSATGYNDHLPSSGVAIHLVDQRPEACRSQPGGAECTNELRHQTPLVSSAPNTDLLRPGGRWSGEGWTVTVVSNGATWIVEVS